MIVNGVTILVEFRLSQLFGENGFYACAIYQFVIYVALSHTPIGIFVSTLYR